MANGYFIFIFSLLVFNFILETVADLLNEKAAVTALPAEMKGYYDEEKYHKAQEYLRVNTRFKLLNRMIGLAAFFAFWLDGGFGMVDTWVRGFGFGEIITGLLFVGTLSFLSGVLEMPFSVYHTFVIEERFGFNKTTIGTFIGDRIKGLVLGALLGAPVFALLIFFFQTAGNMAWFYAWAALTGFQLFLQFIAPVTIMPLFNKFQPLQAGELKSAIEAYAAAQSFKLNGIFTMDGSKRSTKANAYFTGFGRFRRIVLFDTLIAKQTTEELVAVLAHEIGHFKEKHIIKGTVMSILVSGAMFFGVSMLMNNQQLFDAFQVSTVSVYGSLVFILTLFSPVSSFFGVFSNYLSRKHEFEADAYSSRTYHKPEALISALKKLSVENLSNMTPHPLKVLLDYTHPPVLDRIRVLRSATP